MSDRHFELPVHPNLDYYRKQAKHLHGAFEAGDAEAAARAGQVLGDRAAERFLLSDAQFVLAQEHGFRSWADFRTHIEELGSADDRPVSRLAGLSREVLERMAEDLLVTLGRDDADALRRLRAYVPRHAGGDAGAVELRDARLVIAREFGCPTWRELLSYVAKNRQSQASFTEERRRLTPEIEALLADDTGRLADLTGEQADSLLHLIALPEAIPGVRLDRELGVPRAAVKVLLGKATDLSRSLGSAVRANRVEYVRMLLAAGAASGDWRKWGVAPLETAIHSGHTEIVDLLAEQQIVPAALWTYAACGRLDLVRSCFSASGALRPDAATPRPTAAGIGMLTSVLVPDTPEQILGEAFVFACQHGRVEVVGWLLDRGVRPDAAPFHGQTGLHLAIVSGQVEMVRLLLARGADPTIRDELFRCDAAAWLHMFLLPQNPDDPAAQQIRNLIMPG